MLLGDLAEYMEHCRNLKADETPDYAYLKELLAIKDVDESSLFDWELPVL